MRLSQKRTQRRKMEAKMAVDKTEKEERATTPGSTGRRTGEAEERKVAGERGASPIASSIPHDVPQGQRHQHYLIALRPGGTAFASASPQPIDAIAEYLERQEDVEI